MSDITAMQFYRRSRDVADEIEEMSAEGKKTAPLSAARDDGAAAADVDGKRDDDTRSSYSLMMLFKDPELRQPLFIACALMTIQQFSGINAVCRTRRSCYCCSDRSHFHSVLRMRTTVKFYELKSS